MLATSYFKEWRNKSVESNFEDDDLTKELTYQEHKELSLELKNYRNMYGEANTKPMPLLETVEVELNVPYAKVIFVCPDLTFPPFFHIEVV